VRSSIQKASAATVTALALQFAATNAPLSALDGLFVSLLSRAGCLLPACSLQQLGDLAWAFHKAGLPPAQLQSFDESLRAAMLRRLSILQQSTAQEVPLVPPTRHRTSRPVEPHAEPRGRRRQNVHEAANTLLRLVQIGVIAPESKLAVALLSLVEAGASQVCACSTSHRVQLYSLMTASLQHSV
jgi:hypothetical protein